MSDCDPINIGFGEHETEIRAEDLGISVERRPPGVQPVKTYSGVKIEHLPTGLIAFCGTEKSQLRNKEIALIMLRAGLSANAR